MLEQQEGVNGIREGDRRTATASRAREAEHDKETEGIRAPGSEVQAGKAVTSRSAVEGMVCGKR